MINNTIILSSNGLSSSKSTINIILLYILYVTKTEYDLFIIDDIIAVDKFTISKIHKINPNRLYL